MKKVFTLIVFTISFVMQAQMSKQQINKELHDIYAEYDTAQKPFYDKFLGKYTEKIKHAKNDSEKQQLENAYKTDYEFYLTSIKPFQITKINNLKNLISKIDASRPLIGKKIISGNSASKKQTDTIDSTTEKELSDLRREFADQFDSSYLDYSETIRAAATFKVDTDGIIKNVTTTGPNEEFNYLVTICFYTLDKKISVAETNGVTYPKNYSFPIVLNLE